MGTTATLIEEKTYILTDGIEVFETRTMTAYEEKMASALACCSTRGQWKWIVKETRGTK